MFWLGKVYFHHSCYKRLHYLVCTLTRKPESCNSPCREWCVLGKTLLPLQRNVDSPIKLRNDQLTVIVASIYRGSTLSSLDGPGWQPFLPERLKSTPAISPPIVWTFSMKGLSIFAAKTGRERTLMMLFGGFLQNAWDCSATRLIVSDQLRSCFAQYQTDVGIINMFMQNIPIVTVMSTNDLASRLQVASLQAALSLNLHELSKAIFFAWITSF